MLSKQPNDNQRFNKKGLYSKQIIFFQNLNSYVGDILLLVQILLTLAFTSVHYFLNHLIDFDQTGIDTLLRGGEELIRFWWPLKCLIRYLQYDDMSSSPPLVGILASKD